MSKSHPSQAIRRSLPSRPNIDHLRSTAKRHLDELRKIDPEAKLHTTQLQLAREYGFPSWRALKAYVDAVLAPSDDWRTRPESLPEAADRKDIERVRELLQKPDVAQHDLDLALARGLCGQGDDSTRDVRFAIADLLIDAGANPNGQYGGNYGPIVFAICEGLDADALEYLIAHGADVSFGPISTKYGMQTPMSHTFTYVRGRNAAKHRCVELLIQQGAVYQESPALCIHRGDVAGLRDEIQMDPGLLHQCFSEWNGIGNLNLGGATLLHFAIEFGERDCVDLLLDAGADMNLKAEVFQGAGGQTPIFHAIQSWKGAHFSLLRHLVQREGDRIDWSAKAVLRLHGENELSEVSALDYAARNERERTLLISLGLPVPPPPRARDFPPEILKQFRDALQQGAGNPHLAHAMLHEHPGLASSRPWAPDWNGTAIEGLAGRCVWHRPHMHEIARMLVDHGAEADLPTLARCGLLKELRQRLQDDPSVIDRPDDKGRTALYRASCVYGAFSQGEAVAGELMRLGAHVDIWTACTLGLVDDVQKILAEDPGMANAMDPEGMRPLHWACRNRRNREHETEIVRRLCEAGADLEAPNPTEEGMHPLHHCAEWMSQTATAELLLKAGASIDAVAKGSGFTPLDYAIDRGRHPMISFLSEQGAKRASQHDDLPRQFLRLVSEGNVNDVLNMLAARPDLVHEKAPHPLWGGQPLALHVAIERGHDVLFEILLEKGSSVDGVGAAYDGWTPLLLALYHSRSEMVSRLLTLGAAVNLPEALLLEDDAKFEDLVRKNPQVVHETMPSIASAMRFARTVPAAQKLLSLGVSPTRGDRYGKTPIESIAACGVRVLPVVEFLISQGVEAPPQVLAAMGLLDALILAAHQDPEIGFDPRIAITAIESGQIDILRWMLEAGLPVDTRDPQGSKGTLLHTAAWNGSLEAATLLVEHGANLGALDEEYGTPPARWARTALERMGRQSCLAVAEYLESHG